MKLHFVFCPTVFVVAVLLLCHCHQHLVSLQWLANAQNQYLAQHTFMYIHTPRRVVPTNIYTYICVNRYRLTRKQMDLFAIVFFFLALWANCGKFKKNVIQTRIGNRIRLPCLSCYVLCLFKNIFFVQEIIFF